MADPQTSTVGLYAPSHGSYTGSWDVPVNNNSAITDALFGNVATVSLTGLATLNFSITNPIPNTASSWAGPYPQQSGIIKFTGTLSSSCTVTLPRAGFYLIHNTCTVGSFAVILSGGAGNVIGMPPGEASHVYSDGTNMSFVNLGRVGSAFDLHGATAIPAWITASTVKPYLLKDGTLYSIATYPILANLLGTQFGGDGVTTFGVPDERARMRIPLDTNNGGFSNRLTVASGQNINGQTMGSAGGEQVHLLGTTEMPAHNHPVSPATHSHTTYSFAATASISSGTGSLYPQSSTGANTGNQNLATTNTGGGLSHNNVQPGIVSFLPLIKT